MKYVSALHDFNVLGVKIIPVSNWTLAEKGLRQIEITGIDDKRDMTALLAATASGELLPPQLLYQGKTTKCLPVADFPKEWDVHYSPNHWSNHLSMVRYIDTIIIPYVESRRRAHGKPTQPALCIFDVFRAHQTQDVLQKLKDNNIRYVFVPASCTDRLQPLDLTVNKVYKEKMKAQFEEWYSEKVEAQLKSGVSIGDVQVNLNLSVIKPVHANWLIHAHQSVAKQPALIRLGFIKSGITMDPNNSSQSGGASDDTLPPSPEGTRSDTPLPSPGNTSDDARPPITMTLSSSDSELEDESNSSVVVSAKE